MLEKLLIDAQKPNKWDLANGILYDLCRNNPAHNDVSVIVAKIWLIGRSYAAAIERGRADADSNDDYYITKVAPKIHCSEIDTWFKKCNELRCCATNLPTQLDIHNKVTDLFYTISGKRNRSLASKYLHFHFPDFFFIYDSRASKGLSKFTRITGRASHSKHYCDQAYRKFADKCMKLKEHINDTHSICLNPRQLDNLLLSAEEADCDEITE